ncbi:MAG: hypothetical protein SGBAC_009931 [Bacillariaceae sp.]
MESRSKQDARLLLTSILLFFLFLYGSIDNDAIETESASSESQSQSQSASVVQKKSFVNEKAPATLNPPTSPPTVKEFIEEKEEEGGAIRILCFGDSLTAGIQGIRSKQGLAPYGPYLEAALKKLQPKSKEDGIIRPVCVNHTGLPGYTSYDLNHWSARHPPHLNQTLNTFKQEDGTSSLDMVIIMAGTNDLLQQGWLDFNISKSVISMHQLVLDEHNIPLTIALDIPASQYFAVDEKILKEKETLSQNLQTYAKSELRATFVPFPFPYYADDNKWSKDGLHCSKSGYKQLAKSLAPEVQKSLQVAGLW